MNTRWILPLFAGLLLAGCAAGPWDHPPDRWCAGGGIVADAHFEGGQLGQCQASDDGVFELTFFPEDRPPINPSPWFAFRLSGAAGGRAKLRLRFEHGPARYWPKVSEDGADWQPLPKDAVAWSDDGAAMEFTVELPGHRLWIAAQEVLASDYYDAWMRELGKAPGMSTRLAGTSRQGRTIYLAETAPRPEFVVLIGRQHPPEITGARAMRAFVAEVLGDSPLAARFRDRFQLLIVPLMNPDGVAAGHWRHNDGGTDLNRDWGPFTQPETRIVRDWMEQATRAGGQPVLMLDFHSTQKNVFYTQRDEDPTRPENFTARWLAAASAHLPGYQFDREAAEVSEQANCKNYFYSRYGIPAITYETGDETAREDLENAAAVFAEEMMRLLLEYPPPANVANHQEIR